LQDCTLATKWLSEAAFGGNADAAKEIATLIEQGRCFDPSERRALVWDELAAENGDTEAPNAIREIYLGRGDVPANLAKAAVWFRIGAMAFDANAYHHLGEMYWSGPGVPKDLVEAYKWLDLADSLSVADRSGITASAEQRDKICEERMPGEVAEGQRRAVTFFISIRWQPALKIMGVFLSTKNSRQDQKKQKEFEGRESMRSSFSSRGIV
jgi:hypothetical protein